MDYLDDMAVILERMESLHDRIVNRDWEGVEATYGLVASAMNRLVNRMKGDGDGDRHEGADRSSSSPYSD